jgi:hypothetical protein
MLAKSKSKGKRQRKELHHRVPDFKLVDCTPKPMKYQKNKKRIKVSVINEK